jgi:hypothetical protein
MGVIEELRDEVAELKKTVARLCGRIGHDVRELDSWERHPRYTHKCESCGERFLPTEVTSTTSFRVISE